MQILLKDDLIDLIFEKEVAILVLLRILKDSSK